MEALQESQTRRAEHQAKLRDAPSTSAMMTSSSSTIVKPETHSVATFDEFLNMCNMGEQQMLVTDPWNRLSALEHDCVLLIEFSENVGPQVIQTVPTVAGSHFQPNDFALWLMTADYQVGCRSQTGFSLPHDIQTVSRNEEQGVHTCAHFFTLLDIEARGFVRPMCLAYLTADATKASQIAIDLFESTDGAVSHLKRCNRKLFTKQLEAAIEVLDSVENQAISSYYELYYDNNRDVPASATADTQQQPPPASTKTREKQKADQINTRLRKLHREYVLAYRCLQTEAEISNSLCVNTVACNTNHVATSDSDRWLNNLINDSDRDTETGMKPLAELDALAPCAHSEFCRFMRQVWSEFHRRTPMSRYLDFDQHDTTVHSSIPSLQLYADSVPLLCVDLEDRTRTGTGLLSNARNVIQRQTSKTTETHLHQDNNNKQTDQRTCDEHDVSFDSTTDVINSNNNTVDNSVLLPVLRSLGDILLPLWTGQPTLLCGSKENKMNVVRLVQRLRRLMPTWAANGKPIQTPYLVWCERMQSDQVNSQIEPSLIADFKLCGHELSVNRRLPDLLPVSVRPFVAAIDLNAAELYVPWQKSRFIDRLGSKSPRQFPGDASLLAYCRALLADLAQCAYVSYYFMYCSPDVYRRNVRYLARFAQTLALEPADLKIVKYLVELLKQQQVDTTLLDGNVEHELFLDCASPTRRVLKISKVKWS